MDPRVVEYSVAIENAKVESTKKALLPACEALRAFFVWKQLGCSFLCPEA